MAEMNHMETLSPVTNGAAGIIAYEEPYMATFIATGTAPLLFHAWSVDAVAEKSKARKGSKAKKEDDVESYVYRTDEGELAIPGEYFRQAIIHAAKFRQDPRSPRKSAMDLFKAGVAVLSIMCPLGSKEWDYLDRRRVMVQRNGITRTRPAMNTGWSVTCQMQILLPEYIEPAMFLEVLTMAGRIVGIADFRPTYGRFSVTGFRTGFDA